MAINTYYPTTINGTASALLFQAPNLSALALQTLVDTLTTQFQDQTRIELKGQDAFCTLINTKYAEGSAVTYEDILESVLFQSMKPLTNIDEKIVTLIAPRTFKAAKEYFQATVDQDSESRIIAWYARLSACWLTREQIEAYQEPTGANAESLMEERKTIGRDLNQAIENQTLSQAGYANMLSILESILHLITTDSMPTEAAALSLAAKYITWTSKTDNPVKAAEDLLAQLKAGKNHFFSQQT